jgi:nitrogen fixation/metabolism regulation signal transduction histidine kinase
MKLRQQFRVSLAVLVGFQLITAFGAIGLLSRMTPAIANILSENEYTIEAAHEMLLVLARRTFDPGEAALEQQFREALKRAKNNITEPGEPEVLAQLELLSTAALAGDPAALRDTVDGIRRLVQINRQAMRHAESEARRLGTAGAWAAVFLALAAMAASILVSRRLAGRLLDPLGELFAVTESGRQGDHFRRCRKSGASGEMSRLLESVNLLLDQATAHETVRAAKDEGTRAVALYLLSERPEPAFVVDRQGSVAMANTAGLDALSGPQAADLRQELSAAASGGASGGRLRVDPIRDSGLWLCVAG